MAEKELTTVVQEAYVQGGVHPLGRRPVAGMTGIAKSQVSQLCAEVAEVDGRLVLSQRLVAQ
jgi:hypothetical protein